MYAPFISKKDYEYEAKTMFLIICDFSVRLQIKLTNVKMCNLGYNNNLNLKSN